MKTNEKIKMLEKERREIYRRWHDKMAFPYSDDYIKMKVAKKEYDELGRKIKRLKGLTND